MDVFIIEGHVRKKVIINLGEPNLLLRIRVFVGDFVSSIEENWGIDPLSEKSHGKQVIDLLLSMVQPMNVRHKFISMLNFANRNARKDFKGFKHELFKEYRVIARFLSVDKKKSSPVLV